MRKYLLVNHCCAVQTELRSPSIYLGDFKWMEKREWNDSYIPPLFASLAKKERRILQL